MVSNKVVTLKGIEIFSNVFERDWLKDKVSVLLASLTIIDGTDVSIEKRIVWLVDPMVASE